MTTILLLMGGAISAGVGILLQHVAGQDGVIIGVGFGAYVMAVLFVVCAVWNVIITIARRKFRKNRVLPPKRKRHKL